SRTSPVVGTVTASARTNVMGAASLISAGDRGDNAGIRLSPLPAICPERLPARRPSVTTQRMMGGPGWPEGGLPVGSLTPGALCPNTASRTRRRIHFGDTLGTPRPPGPSPRRPPASQVRDSVDAGREAQTPTALRASRAVQARRDLLARRHPIGNRLPDLVRRILLYEVNTFDSQLGQVRPRADRGQERVAG